MKFSTKTTYGLRSLIYLSKSKGRISLKEIADHEDISQAYLERIFSKLKKAGLITSEKGSKGGYKLARKIYDISFLDALEALEGPLNLFHCLFADKKVKCSRHCDCAVNKYLLTAQEKIKKSLKDIKLDAGE